MAVRYLDKRSGIYVITNLVNNKIYIGSTVKLYNRAYEHLRTLKKGEHKNHHLQSSYNKYGEINFQFDLIEYCDKEELLEREQIWIDFFKPDYNIDIVAGSTLGIKLKPLTEKRKKEISIFNIKRWSSYTVEERMLLNKKISKGRMGVKVIPESAKNMNQHCNKPVLQFDKQGNFIKEWKSYRQSERETGAHHVSHVCNNKRKTSGGFIWKYKEEKEVSLG